MSPQPQELIEGFFLLPKSYDCETIFHKENVHTFNKGTNLKNGKQKTLKWGIVLNKLWDILIYKAFINIKVFDQYQVSKYPAHLKISCVNCVLNCPLFMLVVTDSSDKARFRLNIVIILIQKAIIRCSDKSTNQTQMEAFLNQPFSVNIN